MAFDLKSYAAEKRRGVDAALGRMLPPESERPAVLHRAMRYSVFAGGKRLRPVLCLAACAAAGGADDDAMPAAAALEILHTYTLIHDDLPCMDDDDLRRGRPTNHKVFGEANALLAGDALLTMTFEWLADTHPRPSWTAADLIRELAAAAGSRGVIGGQVEDLAAENTAPDADLVAYIHRHKTAALIRAAVRMGGMAGGATRPAIEALGAYGEQVGLAFQVADDILNETSTAAALGKAAGSDRARGKTTYVSVFGLDRARAQASALVKTGLDALIPGLFPGPLEPLAAIARYAIERKE